MDFETDAVGLLTGTINDFFYIFSKSLILYLAYLRCGSVFPPWRNFSCLHYTVIWGRFFYLAISICQWIFVSFSKLTQLTSRYYFLVFAMDIVYLLKCHLNPHDIRCENLGIIQKLTFVKYLRNIFAPGPRIYYGIAEGIFLVMLFRTLKKIKKAPEMRKLLWLRTIQTIFFVFDLIFTITMIACKIIALFETVLLYDYIGRYS